MRTEFNSRISRGMPDTTWAARNFIIVALVLFGFPSLMVLASSFEWANSPEADHAMPASHFVAKGLTHSETSPGSLNAASETRCDAVSPHHEFCPHAAFGSTGSCCPNGAVEPLDSIPAW